MTEPPPSQTLSRGIRILEVLADVLGPLSIDDIARAIEVHRSVAYRLIRTLEIHGLIERDVAGRFGLGARLAALATGVERDLQAEALPELTSAANDLAMTCFLVVLDHSDCVTLTSVEPRHAAATVAQRPGTRHPVAQGAPGKALLAQMPEQNWPPTIAAEFAADVRQCADRGWTESQNEVISSLHAVAVPLGLRGRAPAALAAVYLPGGRDAASVAARLSASAAAIRGALEG